MQSHSAAIFSYLMIFIIKYNELAMKNNRIRLTESQLRQVIKESVNTIMEKFNPNAGNQGFDNTELKELSDAISNVRQVLGRLHWKTMHYETYAYLQPRMDEIDDLLKKAVRLADPDYAVKYEHN